MLLLPRVFSPYDGRGRRHTSSSYSRCLRAPAPVWFLLLLLQGRRVLKAPEVCSSQDGRRRTCIGTRALGPQGDRIGVLMGTRVFSSQHGWCRKSDGSFKSSVKIEQEAHILLALEASGHLPLPDNTS